MKNSLRLRRLVGALMLGAITLMLMIPVAEAGGRGKHGGRHGSARAYAVESRGGGREFARQDYSGDACAVSSHAAHRFFDGRFYCAGKTADGYWRSDQRCEDECGRRLVDDPRWVQEALDACW